jgi:AAA domain
MQPQQILAALADLAPTGGERILDVPGSGEPLVWLAEPDRAPRSRPVDRLAALDALHRDERNLRRGWAVVFGGVDDDGTRRTVRLPLLTQPVRLERALRGYRVVAAGDLELTPLVEDRELAARLEAAPGLGGAAWLAAAGTAAWITTAAEAAGLPVARVVARAPRRRPEDELIGVAATALFVARDARTPSLRGTLLRWAGRSGLEETALAAVYGCGPAPELSTVDDAEVRSPLPLNAAQREVVRRTRSEVAVTVSGPPGTGKSHAVVAAAIDAVDRGGSVLIAAQSSHAVDALRELLRRYPGATPVLFGDAERREAIAAELSDGLLAGVGEERLRADAATVHAAAQRELAVRDGIAAALDTERRAVSLAQWEPLLPTLRVDAPRAFEPGFDLAAARRLAARSGRWARWRLRRKVGARGTVPPGVLDAAAAAQSAALLAATGGTDLGPAWTALTGAQAALAKAVGTAMRDRSAAWWRLDRAARRSAVALGAALTAGRNRRRELLAGLDGRGLVRALPLWVGTVTDVEDLLPPMPGLFDLVILDEAAHIDQIRAAPVLARAKRALVVGDPRQLRFVSFVADVDVAVTLQRHGLAAAADRLDVRRTSAFDLAAGTGAVTWLGEHYRSAPHLIEFSARRFYKRRLALVTRHPRNERADLIDVVRVAGDVADGVNRAEVSAVVDLVRSFAAQGTTGIGVVTPFRGQADALEAALLAAFPVAEIERLGLRSGTVHSFQGSEADLVVVSLGLAEGDGPARYRFVADPNLFNVMVTRARQRMVVVTSLASADGLVGEYLSYAASGPAAAPDPSTVDGWAGALGTELRKAGVPVRAGYPVGDWRVDLCVGTGDAAVGLVCAVHPDGTAAHIERQETLLRAGWRLVDAFPSRWDGDAVRAALELIPRLAAAPPSAAPVVRPAAPSGEADGAELL